MRAKDADGVGVIGRQHAYAALVGHACIGVDLHQSLIATQARRAGALLAVDFAVMKIGIASIEQPLTVVFLDCDAGMPLGMAG